MNFDKIINKIINEDALKGGLAAKHTPESIAKMHDVPVEDIIKQIEKGVKVEYEHTPVQAIAMDITLDHLVEIPYYYDYLEDMENMAKEKQNMKEEMVSGGTGSAFSDGSVNIGQSGGSVGNAKNVYGSDSDTRIPFVLGAEEEKKKSKGKKKPKGKKKKMTIQRRPFTGL